MIVGDPDDDENELPSHLDVVGPDNSQLAWLEVLKHRTYYQVQIAAGAKPTVRNNTPFPIDVQFQTQHTISNTNSTSDTLSAEIKASISPEIGDIGTTVGSEMSTTETWEESTSETQTEDYTLPACTVVTTYHTYKITEVFVEYVYFRDFFGAGMSRIHETATLVSTTYIGESKESDSVAIVPAP